MLLRNGSIHTGNKSLAYSDKNPRLERYRMRNDAEDVVLVFSILSDHFPFLFSNFLFSLLGTDPINGISSRCFSLGFS